MELPRQSCARSARIPCKAKVIDVIPFLGQVIPQAHLHQRLPHTKAGGKNLQDLLPPDNLKQPCLLGVREFPHTACTPFIRSCPTRHQVKYQSYRNFVCKLSKHVVVHEFQMPDNPKIFEQAGRNDSVEMIFKRIADKCDRFILFSDQRFQ
ncbi:hypothetical protein T07_6799 [Trichinella nelsoni]|uniref:Uncharacterized protein n=1 Tax=Trichinella nelsoni TaxID=6336 RepID=A0A0V0RZ11_9BILA|nr:hypothetical protein T07_6799 [Trichinella nelsoni]